MNMRIKIKVKVRIHGSPLNVGASEGVAHIALMPLRKISCLLFQTVYCIVMRNLVQQCDE